MRLIDRPMFFPELTIQGRAGGPVVDTECEHPGGRIYVDWLEGFEIAQLYGFTTPDQVERFQARIAELEAQLAERDARLERIAEFVSGAVLAV